MRGVTIRKWTKSSQRKLSEKTAQNHRNLQGFTTAIYSAVMR